MDELKSSLGIDSVKYGQALILLRKPDSTPREVECEKTFDKEVKKLKHIRSSHSPVIKMMFLH